MLSEETIAGFPVFRPCRHRDLTGAFALEMQDGKPRIVDHLPSLPSHPSTPVGLFQEEEVVLVQGPDLFEGFSAYQHARADDGIHLDGPGQLEFLSRVLSGKEPPQKTFVGEFREKRGIAGDGILLGSVRIEELEARDPNGGIGGHGLD